MKFEISTTGWWRHNPQCAMVPHAGRASVRPLLPHKTKQNNFILFQLDRSINRQSFTSTSWDFSLKHKSWVKWFHFFPPLCSEIEAALRSDRESVEVKMDFELLMIKNINCQHHHHRLTDACLSVSLIFSSLHLHPLSSPLINPLLLQIHYEHCCPSSSSSIWYWGHTWYLSFILHSRYIRLKSFALKRA